MRIAILLVVLAFVALPTAKAAPINNSTEPVQEVHTVTEVVQVTPTSVETIQSEAPTPEPQKPVETERPPEPIKETVAHPIGCEQYRQLLSQYDWNVSVAMAIMKAESSCNSQVVNRNQNTRDYSVGLFQINLYGANARTRPSETELKDPATNIAWAYRIYQGNGKSFIGQWGVCRAKVSCY